MKIRFARGYRKEGTGTKVFVYTVTGNQEELEAYKVSQGEYLKEDEKGNPLYFTTNFAGQNAKLLISSKGKAVVDMSAFEQMASLVEQFDGKFADALAKQAVEKLLGSSTPSTSVSEEPKEIEASNEDTDLENL